MPLFFLPRSDLKFKWRGGNPLIKSNGTESIGIEMELMSSWYFGEGSPVETECREEGGFVVGSGP